MRGQPADAASCERLLRHTEALSFLGAGRYRRENPAFWPGDAWMLAADPVELTFLDPNPEMLLKPGVLVHIRDIFAGWQYPAEWEAPMFNDLCAKVGAWRRWRGRACGCGGHPESPSRAHDAEDWRPNLHQIGEAHYS